MEVEIFSLKDYITTNWSGGETTQLYIYPKEATYVKRNFDLRISSATVNLSKSEFTNLPNVDRLLMSLDNEVILQHNNSAKIKLRPLDVHKFSGDDLTISYGKCRDFNIMLRRNSYKKADLFTNKAAEFDLYNDESKCFLYVYKGEYTVNIGQTYTLKTGDLMTLKNFPYGKIQRRDLTSIMLVFKLS